MNTKFLIASAIAAAVAIPAATLTTTKANAAAPSFVAEKCYGIALKGLNDCKTTTHSCAGSASMDRDPASWLFVPKGECGKIAGGSLTPGA